MLGKPAQCSEKNGVYKAGVKLEKTLKYCFVGGGTSASWEVIKEPKGFSTEKTCNRSCAPGECGSGLSHSELISTTCLESCAGKDSRPRVDPAL